MVKNPPAMQDTWGQSLCPEDPLEEGMEPTLVFLSGESHGQRSLKGCSPGFAQSQTQLTDQAHNTADCVYMNILSVQ